MVFLPVLWAAVSVASFPEVTLKCVSGEVRWGPERREPDGTLTPGAEGARATEPFRFSGAAGAKLEMTTGDLAVRLTGPFEGAFRLSADRPAVSLGRAGAFTLSVGEAAVFVAVGKAYGFEAEKALVEGSLAEDGEVVLTNRAGLPLSLYRDGSWVDVLPEGMRARMGRPQPTSPSSPAEGAAPEGSGTTTRWGGRTIELPPGVFSYVEGGRCILEGGEDLVGAAVVRIGGDAFILRAGGIVEIDANGNVVTVHGAVRRVAASGGASARNPFARSQSVPAVSTGVVVVSPTVP